MKAKYSVLLSVCLLLCMSCKSVPFSGKTDVQGMVYDFDNKAVVGYSFYIEDKLVAVTDITGRFSVNDLSAGEYTITGQGDEHENFTHTFSLVDQKQILYVRVPTKDQLLDLVEHAFAEKDYDSVYENLNRVFTKWPNDSSAYFYKAILHIEKDEIDEALDILQYLEQKSHSNMAVYLFLADIFQYKKNDREMAIVYLEKYLARQDNAEIKERLEDLKNESL